MAAELHRNIPNSVEQYPGQPQEPGRASIAPTNSEIERDHDAADLERAKAANEKALQDSREGVWFLKEIFFNGEAKKIVTQNYNGPCSFIAICNILILRGDIQILPRERTSVSYDILSQLVGEYLLRASPDVDLSAALTMMPLTQKGMDLNPLFTSPTAFRPAGDNGALKLFEQAGIPLVHGWLSDPSSTEHRVLSSAEDYDSAVNLIVEVDTLTKGQFVVDENAPGPSSSSSSAVAGPSGGLGHVSDNWSSVDNKKVEDALVVRNFLDSTSSQMTYHGLFTLASAIRPGSLVALFRNSHLSVLYRRATPFPPSSSTAAHTEPIPTPDHDLNHETDLDSDPGLYNLVTDYVFYNEPSVVWERLEDVDGGGSTFVDADFRRSNPVGGDFAGAVHHQSFLEEDSADQALARQLQAEEDARAHAFYAQQDERRRQQQQYQQQQQQQQQQGQPQQIAPYQPRDPRYIQYMQQQQQIQSQGQGNGQGQPQNAGKKPSKMKRKTSCTIM